MSIAPALAPGDPGSADMLAALEGIFQAYQRDGAVTIEHEALVVYGRPRDG